MAREFFFNVYDFGRGQQGKGMDYASRAAVEHAAHRMGRDKLLYRVRVIYKTKSEIVAARAKRLGIPVTELKMTSMSPEDIKGYVRGH